jgi:hypothetical protein
MGDFISCRFKRSFIPLGGDPLHAACEKVGKSEKKSQKKHESDNAAQKPSDDFSSLFHPTASAASQLRGECGIADLRKYFFHTIY